MKILSSLTNGQKLLLASLVLTLIPLFAIADDRDPDGGCRGIQACGPQGCTCSRLFLRPDRSQPKPAPIGCKPLALMKQEISENADTLERAFDIPAESIQLSPGLNYFAENVDLDQTSIAQRDFVLPIQLSKPMVNSGYAILAVACNADDPNIGVVFHHTIYDHPKLGLRPMNYDILPAADINFREPRLALNPHLHNQFNIRFSAGRSFDSNNNVLASDAWHGHMKVAFLIIPTNKYAGHDLPYDEELSNFLDCPSRTTAKARTPQNPIDHEVGCWP